MYIKKDRVQPVCLVEVLYLPQMVDRVQPVCLVEVLYLPQMVDRVQPVCLVVRCSICLKW